MGRITASTPNRTGEFQILHNDEYQKWSTEHIRNSLTDFCCKILAQIQLLTTNVNLILAQMQLIKDGEMPKKNPAQMQLLKPLL